MCTRFVSSIKPLTLIGAIALAGCASFADVKPGTPLSEVISQHGQPTVTCPEANNNRRVVWTEQPAGEQAWATSVDANNRVGPFTQMLTEDQFQAINQGDWDITKLRCQFGPPANVQRFQAHPNETVWEYHYLGGAGDEYMMLWVTVQQSTDRVLNYTTGMDPTLNPTLTNN